MSAPWVKISLMIVSCSVTISMSIFQPSAAYIYIPYSWKFLRDKNFEVFADFDLSAKIKTLK